MEPALTGAHNPTAFTAPLCHRLTTSPPLYPTPGSESVGFPVDKFEVDRAALMSRETGADLTVRHNIRKNPMKNFAEAALGNTCDNSGREGFLKYDRKVQRKWKTTQPPPGLPSPHSQTRAVS